MLAGACQRHGVGVFFVRNATTNNTTSSQMVRQIRNGALPLVQKRPAGNYYRPPAPSQKTPRPRATDEPQKDPPPSGREHERRQYTGTPPRRNRPVPALRTPYETSRKPHRTNAGRPGSLKALVSGVAEIAAVSPLRRRWRPTQNTAPRARRQCRKKKKEN